MKTYRVRVGAAGEPIQVATGDGWLRAADLGATLLGVAPHDVQVEVDDRVGFISPRSVST